MNDKNTIQKDQAQTQPQSPITQPEVEKVDTSMAVTKRDVENVVSSWTGIPISKLTEDESAKLLQLEDRIHLRLVDQEEGVVKVAEAVRRGRIGLASGQRPIASFIFLGPSGTGKTELAKTLAEILFGRDDAMIRLDMSEYMEKHEVAKLIGAPPGYVGYEEGGQLTEAVRAKPYSIVLLDEVEKAHPDVFNILLQLLEDGRLTDNKGNTISFKNTIVICTSNIGSGLITEKLGEQDTKKEKSKAQFEKDFAELSTLVNTELRKFFRPELLNRYDDIVIFKPLQRADMVGIAKRGLEKTAKLLKEQNFSIKVTEQGLNKLAQEGYDPMYGARPLRRLIQTSIENPIALQIIGKQFVQGDVIVIDYDTKTNQFTFQKDVSSKPPVKPGDNTSGINEQPQQTLPQQDAGNVPGGVSPATTQTIEQPYVYGQSMGDTQVSVQNPVSTTFDPLSVLPQEAQSGMNSQINPLQNNGVGIIDNGIGQMSQQNPYPQNGGYIPGGTGQMMQSSGFGQQMLANEHQQTTVLQNGTVTGSGTDGINES